VPGPRLRPGSAHCAPGFAYPDTVLKKQAFTARTSPAHFQNVEIPKSASARRLETVSSAGTILFITQVYPPDPAAGGQLLADAAMELARRGHQVHVITSDRGYDDPSLRYAAHEVMGGVVVRRVPWSSLGKGSAALRLLASVLFTVQATIHGLTMRGVDRIVVLSVPIFSAMCALALTYRRGARVLFWIMDLTPDQFTALKILPESSWFVRMLDWFNRALLRRVPAVVVLDRHMARRVRAKEDPGARLHIIPPWADERELQYVPPEENPFRHEHGLNGRRVVMYSGNHSLSNPLDTVLRAAERVQDDERLMFAFIGGGVRKREVEASGARNILSLPYQRLEDVRFSLSAGDVHVAVIGPEVVGVVHPCKVYSAMALGRPILAVGPRESHLADIALEGAGWHVAPGDVDAAERALREIASADCTVLRAMGARARSLLDGEFNSEALRKRFCDLTDGSAAGA
jgi:colanic acid biosynthesis glycosyl transferase WcaI